MAIDRRGVCTHAGAGLGQAPQKGDPDVPDIAEGSGGIAGVGLTSAGVTDAAMESTGEYWRPLYAVLETGFRLLLVNARHMKHGPGHKMGVRHECPGLHVTRAASGARASQEQLRAPAADLRADSTPSESAIQADRRAIREFLKRWGSFCVRCSSWWRDSKSSSRSPDGPVRDHPSARPAYGKASGRSSRSTGSASRRG